jgi:putative oxidoreductase
MQIESLARHGGRFIVGLFFMLAGINKLLDPSVPAARMAEVGLTPTALLLPATIALELVGGALVAFGRRSSVPAAVLLAVFTLATNVFFHRFWGMTGPERVLELSLFFKNVAIAGALVYIAATAHGDRAEQRV